MYLDRWLSFSKYPYEKYGFEFYINENIIINQIPTIKKKIESLKVNILLGAVNIF